MTTELKYLAWTSLFTAVMWMPYILNMIKVRGIRNAVGFPDNPKPMAPWAQRMKSAHYNAVENLVVFATLVLTAHALGIRNNATAWASLIYFWARVVHYFDYTLGIPWGRTVSFLVGFGCQVAIAWQILF